MDRPVKIVMLGAGGTGGYIAPYLYRLLHMLDRPTRFLICDGDIVELKNLDRQNFVPADLGENKARILAERYSTVLGMETEYVPNFIETLPELMALIAPNLWETDGFRNRYAAEMVILLGCVDNNRTRQLCHEAFCRSDDLVYIDSGNGSYTIETFSRQHSQADKKLRELKTLLKAKNVTLQLSKEAHDFLLKQGYSKEYGAREMDRAIERSLKTVLMREILFGSLKDGGRARVVVVGDELELKK